MTDSMSLTGRTVLKAGCKIFTHFDGEGMVVHKFVTKQDFDVRIGVTVRGHWTVFHPIVENEVIYHISLFPANTDVADLGYKVV